MKMKVIFSLFVLFIVACLSDQDAFTCDELSASHSCELERIEGFVKVNQHGDPAGADENGYRVFYTRYRKLGSGPKGSKDAKPPIPIILVHGGPGLSPDYIDNMKYLACYQRGSDGQSFETLIYHQLCVDKSMEDCPKDTYAEIPDIHTLPYYGRELRALIHQVYPNGEKMHLLGQSWGAVVSLQFILDNKPMADERLISFINANGGVPYTRVFQELIKHKMIPTLNAPYAEILLSENTEHPHWGEAMTYFQQKFYVQFTKQPDCVARAHEKMNLDVHLSLFAKCPWCKSEQPFVMNNIIPRLSSIDVPTLCFYGETDICDKELLDSFNVMKKGKLTKLVIPNTSHMPWVENFDLFWDIVTDWLDETKISRNHLQHLLLDHDHMFDTLPPQIHQKLKDEL